VDHFRHRQFGPIQETQVIDLRTDTEGGNDDQGILDRTQEACVQKIVDDTNREDRRDCEFDKNTHDQEQHEVVPELGNDQLHDASYERRSVLQEIFNRRRVKRLCGQGDIRKAAGMEKVQPITRELIASLIEKAGTAPRRRVNHNFHRRLEENPNRFLNVMMKDSYFTPHRHANPPKPESFLVLEGKVLCIIFDNAGEIAEAHLMGEGAAYGVDVAAGVWHTIAVLSDTAVCYEVKPGPYVASNDKDFAPWAPKEGDPGAPAYAAALLEKALAKLR